MTNPISSSRMYQYPNHYKQTAKPNDRKYYQLPAYHSSVTQLANRQIPAPQQNWMYYPSTVMPQYQWLQIPNSIHHYYGGVSFNSFEAVVPYLDIRTGKFAYYNPYMNLSRNSSPIYLAQVTSYYEVVKSTHEIFMEVVFSNRSQEVEFQLGDKSQTGPWNISIHGDRYWTIVKEVNLPNKNVNKLRELLFRKLEEQFKSDDRKSTRVHITGDLSVYELYLPGDSESLIHVDSTKVSCNLAGTSSILKNYKREVSFLRKDNLKMWFLDIIGQKLIDYNTYFCNLFNLKNNYEKYIEKYEKLLRKNKEINSPESRKLTEELKKELDHITDVYEKLSDYYNSCIQAQEATGTKYFMDLFKCALDRKKEVPQFVLNSTTLVD